MYKKLLVEDRLSRRDQVLAQAAFYSGARCVLRVLDHLVEEGEIDELQRVIRRHGRTIRVLQGQTPRKRQH
jgi:alkylated DNA nucleotide flippase Atl1